jgi:Fe-S-cluster-containing dehydrogenase component
MGDYIITTNPQRCIACHACEIACRSEKKLPLEVTLGKIVVLGPKMVGGRPRMTSLFVPCFHCEKAWCMDACPVEAIRRREKDGLVYILQELCVGCKACIMACPWHVPQWNADAGKAVKCDLCMDRIDAGEQPICVSVCPTNALQFGRPEEISSRTREAYGLGLLEKNLTAA